MKSWRRSGRAIATWRSSPTRRASSSARAPIRPFLLVVGYSDPHRAEQNFGNTRAWPAVARAIYDPAKVVVPAHLPDLPEVRRDLADYYESVSRLDSGIGMLLETLRETGHEGPTRS